MTLQLPSFFTIAENYGTPYYLYDYLTLEASYLSLRKIFPRQLDIFYSIKANPNVTLCAALQKLGACAEVCSLIELDTAIKAGFAARDIIFLGPAKSDAELIACMHKDIAAIVCESKHEFERIALLAHANHKQARVVLRINPNFVSKTASLKMGGQSSQFGIDENILFNEYRFFFDQPQVKVIGIHVYNGTRILDAHTIFDNTQHIFQLFKKITQAAGQQFTLLDIGGGLGVPYFNEEQALDLTQLRYLMTPIINEFINEFPAVRIILETGRFLLAASGIFVSRIVDKKISKDSTYLITDGGTHCHMAAVGIGSFVKRNFPITLVSKNISSHDKHCVQIVGPLCTPGDLLAKNIYLPHAEIGDLIVVHYSGAYGLTASPIMFLSHGFPSELLIKNNQVHLIRSRQTADDFFKNQVLLQDHI